MAFRATNNLGETRQRRFGTCGITGSLGPSREATEAVEQGRPAPTMTLLS